MAHEMNNMLRSLTMLKKALDRLGRLNYFHRKQYPAIFLEIEESIDAIQLWIRKNVGKSPFMLAAGQTHNLPWIQVMNMHNAFLFTEKAL